MKNLIYLFSLIFLAFQINAQEGSFKEYKDSLYMANLLKYYEKDSERKRIINKINDKIGNNFIYDSGDGDFCKMSYGAVIEEEYALILIINHFEIWSLTGYITKDGTTDSYSSGDLFQVFGFSKEDTIPTFYFQINTDTYLLKEYGYYKNGSPMLYCNKNWKTYPSAICSNGFEVYWWGDFFSPCEKNKKPSMAFLNRSDRHIAYIAEKLGIAQNLYELY